jgi:hypothetical protein
MQVATCVLVNRFNRRDRVRHQIRSTQENRNICPTKVLSVLIGHDLLHRTRRLLELCTRRLESDGYQITGCISPSRRDGRQTVALKKKGEKGECRIENQQPLVNPSYSYKEKKKHPSKYDADERWNETCALRKKMSIYQFVIPIQP